MDFLNPACSATAEHVPRALRGADRALRRRRTRRARLRQVTRPFILRRVKTDPTIIDDLPDKIEMKAVLPRSPREQATLYQAVVDDMLEKIENADGISGAGSCWPR